MITSLQAILFDFDGVIADSEPLHLRAFQQILAEETIEANKESVGRHILETHSSTEEAGKMAAEAKVKTLVLYHLLPGANPARGVATDETYISEARKSFSGQIVVGSDQMRI